MITYLVKLNEPESHYLSIELSINCPLNKGQEIWLPDWIPGSYMIRDFSRNIVELTAKEGSKDIVLQKLGKSRWALNENVSELVVSYKVYAWDLSVRSAHFDELHCFFNGTSVFLALQGLESEVHRVKIGRPELASRENWQVATSMSSHDIDKNGFGVYQAKNYAELVDHPFEITNLTQCEFIAGGVIHKMVFSEAPDNIDLTRIAKDVQTICQYEIDFFADGKPPFNSYLFMTFVQKNGFGGLEHQNSTALHCSIEDLPKTYDDPNKKSSSYQKFLSLCSHEYFHSWNVKRIKPAVFRDYHWQAEVNTELLWFFEGITSYYDELFLVRAGVISETDYLDMLAKNITRYLRGTGRHKQSLADSSFDAWNKFYKQDENAPNAIVSYYVKGGLAAFILDFEIRKLSNDNQSLDDLMRAIWKKYGKTSKGLAEKAIQKETELLLGQPMDEFFNLILYSSKDLPLTELLSYLGVNMQLVAENKSLESGGFIEKAITRENQCSLNISHKKHPLGAEIQTVFEQGCASTAGLSNKDVIIAINDYRVVRNGLDKEIASFPKDSEIKISYFRRDKLYHKLFRLTESQVSCCYLSLDKPEFNLMFKDWLKTK